MDGQAVYFIALTKIPQIGTVAARALLNRFQSPEQVFKANYTALSAVEGIGSVRARNIKSFSNFDACHKELEHAQKHHYQVIGFSQVDYPKRLLQCVDAPMVLYKKGAADLNTSRTAAVIGTRHSTEYGKQITQQMVTELCRHRVQIISGLAFGIDTQAHRQTLQASGCTVGVMAHGFGNFYPPENKNLSQQMLENGGALVTEYEFETKADKHNFPVRNRIVAGMADVTVVVETKRNGGSMITAQLANDYNRDVVAVPGRATDENSSGCNYLIRTNQAYLVNGANDILELMNWQSETLKPVRQRPLFVDLSPEEERVVTLLQEAGQMHIDQLNFTSGLSSSTMAAALLNLELKTVVVGLPGRIYKLNE